MMKPSLQLKLGQQLTMTPQLQQAIRLLQLPVLDLSTQIQEALAENVMLELEEPGETTPAPEEPTVITTEAEDSGIWNDTPPSGGRGDVWSDDSGGRNWPTGAMNPCASICYGRSRPSTFRRDRL